MTNFIKYNGQMMTVKKVIKLRAESKVKAEITTEATTKTETITETPKVEVETASKKAK